MANADFYTPSTITISITQFLFLFYFITFFFLGGDKYLFCSSDCPRIRYGEIGLQLRDLPVSSYEVLPVKDCTNTHNSFLIFET